MQQRNWISLALVALAAVVICAALWLMFVDRDEAPGATGSVGGSNVSGSVTPVTPESPGR